MISDTAIIWKMSTEETGLYYLISDREFELSRQLYDIIFYCDDYEKKLYDVRIFLRTLDDEYANRTICIGVLDACERGCRFIMNELFKDDRFDPSKYGTDFLQRLEIQAWGINRSKILRSVKVASLVVAKRHVIQIGCLLRELQHSIEDIMISAHVGKSLHLPLPLVELLCEMEISPLHPWEKKAIYNFINL